MKRHKKKNGKRNNFLNKKGLAGGIMSNISGFLNSILNTMPKPLKFLLFLAIILLIGQMLTYIFNIMGIYCTSGDIPVTIGFNPLYTAELIGDIPDAETIGINDIALNKMLFVNEKKGTSCSIYLTSGIITLQNGTKRNFTNTWFYDGTYCTDCLKVTITEFTGQSWVQQDVSPENGLCYGNVWKKPDNEKSTWKRWTCGSNGGQCEPPEHYYYNYQTNTYVCDETELECREMTIGQKWDDKLKSKGATPLYSDGYGEKREVTHKKILSIQCKDVRPKLTLYGIDIFNLQYWLLLMLIGIMFWALKTWL